MRYILRQQFISLGGDFTIQDDQGIDRYFVDGKVISIGRRLVIKDMQGDELAVIQQRLIALSPSYEIRRKDGATATISRRLISPLVDRLKVNLPGRDDIEVQGDLFDHEYTFYRGGEMIAQASKQWISLVDAYAVDITQGEDDVLILACAIAIDEMIDKRRN
jgi:uncharacterized protein YxjI